MLTYFQAKKSRRHLTALLIGLAGTANAGGPDLSAPAAPQRQQTVANLFYCPPVSALTKDPEARTWSAGPSWKSYELSFVDKITLFSGAQWRGTNVGQIFCVYRGESETSFPVLLAYKTLAFEPNGGKWGANLGGYYNCETPTQEDCPFSIRVQSEKVDIYQQAEQLKLSAPSQSRPGF